MRCFISYSHKDKMMCEKFLTHFGNLERIVDTEHWYDGKIPPGGVIDDMVKKELIAADVVFLLLSPNYINSYYCYEKELITAIRRHEEGKCIFIPVVIRDFVRANNYPFSKLKYVPVDGRPVDSFRSHNDGFVNAFTGIKNLLQQYDRISSMSGAKIGQKKRGSTQSKRNSGASKTPNKAETCHYSIIKNGKLRSTKLTPELFQTIVRLNHTISHFCSDMTAVTLETAEQFKLLSSRPTQIKEMQYKPNMTGFLLQMSGYIQQHFVGYENTCIHFRVKENDQYKDYYDVGYRNSGLSVGPIRANDGMIECSLKHKMPVIKSNNIALHTASHPSEKIRRDYITFAFSGFSDIYNVDLSMCISVIGPSSARTKMLFTAMSICRLDILLEKYLLQYINYCKRIDGRYDVSKVFVSEGKGA